MSEKLKVPEQDVAALREDLIRLKDLGFALQSLTIEQKLTANAAEEGTYEAGKEAGIVESIKLLSDEVRSSESLVSDRLERMLANGVSHDDLTIQIRALLLRMKSVIARITNYERARTLVSPLPLWRKIVSDLKKV